MREFVTPKIAEGLFYVVSALAILPLLFVCFSAFNQGFALGLLGSGLAAVCYALFVILARIGAELLIVVFRIEEHLRRR